MDPSWLAQEAQKVHAIFQESFFVMLAAFLVLAVVLEFFKLPIGTSTAFTTLVGRAIIATLLLVAMPEIMNMFANITDSVAGQIGDLSNFHLVLSRIGEKLKDLSFSWTSLKDMVTILISFLSFFALYVTVYFADAAFTYCWTLIYVFSPLVLALYVFPQTANATGAMFRSMLEVSFWKICWATMATLLWSMALSNVNQPEAHINWLTSIVLMTPKIVRAILGAGFSELSSSAQGAVMGAASLTPPAALAKAKSGLMFLPSKASTFAKAQGLRQVNNVADRIRNRPRVPDFIERPSTKKSQKNRPTQKDS
jgi:hypothetical protein